MSRPFASYRDDAPPAEVRQHVPLFEWAREQAAAVKVTKDRIDEKRADLATVTETVEETMEWKEAEEAREKLKDAKKRAIERSNEVGEAACALSDARKALAKVASFKKQREIKGGIKALETVCVETKDRLASGLAAGKVPQTITDATIQPVEIAQDLHALANLGGKGKRAS